MNKAFLRMTGMLALAFLAATQFARAQEPLLVSIPFEFTAGNITLPAGAYRVQELGRGALALLIQRTDQGAAAFVPSFAATKNAPPTQSKLVFHRYGNRYFLSQVWRAGYPQGRELPKSAKEKEQALSAHNAKPETTTIVARLISPQP